MSIETEDIGAEVTLESDYLEDTNAALIDHEALDTDDDTIDQDLGVDMDESDGTLANQILHILHSDYSKYLCTSFRCTLYYLMRDSWTFSNHRHLVLAS